LQSLGIETSINFSEAVWCINCDSKKNCRGFFVPKLVFVIERLGLGNNLPNPYEVVALYNQNNIRPKKEKKNNIRRMKVYYVDQETLQVLWGFNIELMLGLTNDNLQNVASNQAIANTWVKNNVKNFRNEVKPSDWFAKFLEPAMQNIHNAISAASHTNQIKVSTDIDTRVLGESFSPSKGFFKSITSRFSIRSSAS